MHVLLGAYTKCCDANAKTTILCYLQLAHLLLRIIYKCRQHELVHLNIPHVVVFHLNAGQTVTHRDPKAESYEGLPKSNFNIEYGEYHDGFGPLQMCEFTAQKKGNLLSSAAKVQATCNCMH